MGSYWQSFILSIICYTCLGTLGALAKDFGVVGHVYEIKEQDIIEYIKHQLAKVDLNELNQEMQDKVRANVERPKTVIEVTDAAEDRTYYYDPTFTLDEDVRGSGNELIYPRGTKINPLEKVGLSQALIFINGDSILQVEYALKRQKALDGKAKIILTSGAPLKLQKRHKTWIYFDQFGFLTSKLGIKHVPAVVTQSGLSLKITEVAINKMEAPE